MKLWEKKKKKKKKTYYLTSGGKMNLSDKSVLNSITSCYMFSCFLFFFPLFVFLFFFNDDGDLRLEKEEISFSFDSPNRCGLCRA